MNNMMIDSLPISLQLRRSACFIVGAGDYSHMEILPEADDFVIAADGGYAYLRQSGIRCDLLMGDLDSLTDQSCIDTEIQYYSPIKDDTDTMLAVKYGLEKGYRRFYLYGVFGGRFDHTVATLQTVLYLVQHDAEVVAFEAGSGGHRAYVTAVKNGVLDFPETACGYLSLFALSGAAHGVTLEHLKYPLDQAVLYPEIALGVSNEFLTGQSARVTVTDGVLLVVKPL